RYEGLRDLLPKPLYFRGCGGALPLASKQVPGVFVRSQSLNPCLVMVAFSPSFSIDSVSRDSRKFDATRTRAAERCRRPRETCWLTRPNPLYWLFAAPAHARGASSRAGPTGRLPPEAHGGINMRTSPSSHTDGSS